MPKFDKKSEAIALLISIFCGKKFMFNFGQKLRL